jgi:hypothetical protein
MNANMLDPSLCHFRLDIESRMTPEMWKSILDHHLHAGIGGDQGSVQFVLWLMTLLDDAILATALDRSLLRRMSGTRPRSKPHGCRGTRGRRASSRAG